MTIAKKPVPTASALAPDEASVLVSEASALVPAASVGRRRSTRVQTKVRANYLKYAALLLTPVDFIFLSLKVEKKEVEGTVSSSEEYTQEEDEDEEEDEEEYDDRVKGSKVVGVSSTHLHVDTID